MRKNLIFEEESDSPVSGMNQVVSPPPDSVDDQIDALIIKYENESIVSEDEEDQERMFESLRNLSLRFLIEQEGDEPAASPPEGSETPKKEPAPPEEEKPPLDIDSFTKKVARLVMNAQTLLQVEEVIIVRATEFLRKNYGQSYVDQMEDILDQQYDFDLEGKETIRSVPIAAGAGVKSAGG